MGYDEDEEQSGDTPQLLNVEDEDLPIGGGGGVGGTAPSED